MFSDIFEFGNILGTLEDIVSYIQETVESVASIFSDIDFTILYNWLPSDIVAVITAIIAVLLVLALFGLVRRILWFIG